MKPHATMGQRTLFNMGCTKQKRKEGNGLPKNGQLRTRLDTGVAQWVHEHGRQVAAAIAARPAPPPPRPVGRPRKVVPHTPAGPKLRLAAAPLHQASWPAGGLGCALGRGRGGRGRGSGSREKAAEGARAGRGKARGCRRGRAGSKGKGSGRGRA
eukprot:1161841-Pelagomonas_calceolata.AAC.6